MEEIRISVLGAVSVSGAARPAARQQRVVLAALAAAWPDRVSSDRLLEGLWPTRRPVDARKALQVLVVRLRRCLADVGVGVTLHRDGYSLDVDVDSFDAACSGGCATRSEPFPGSRSSERCRASRTGARVVAR